jgi:hypothetical protein
VEWKITPIELSMNVINCSKIKHSTIIHAPVLSGTRDHTVITPPEKREASRKPRCLLFFFFSLALHPPWALASAFQFHDHFYRR